MCGGLAAAVLLLPLPALALTFNNAWTPTFVTTGGPTPAKATYTDSTSGGDDNVDVSLGNYNGVTSPAVSSITLARSITVPNAGEAVDFLQQFAASFTFGGATATVALANSQGKIVATPLSFTSTNTGSGSSTVSTSQNVKETIAGGTYTLTVKVVFSTNNKIGAWKQISQYNFNIDGL